MTAFAGNETTEESIINKCARISYLPDPNAPPATNTIPNYIELKESLIARGMGVFAKIDMRAGLLFGPYAGVVSEQEPEMQSYTWTVSVAFCSYAFYYFKVHLLGGIHSVFATPI
jgi:hypothetical protein